MSHLTRAALGVAAAGCLLAATGGAAAQGLPELPLPPVHAPSVPTPPLPETPLPGPQQTPSVPLHPSPPAPPAAPAPAPPAPGGGTPQLPGVGGDNGGGDSGSGGQDSGGGSPSGSPGGGGREGSGAPSSSGSSSASDRRLRQAIDRLQGCIGAATSFEQRVLLMRAGFAGAALTRRATARQLGTTSGRIGRAERSGLRRLRGASRSGACESQGSAVGLAIAQGGAAGAASGGSEPGGKKDAGDRGGVLAVSRASEQVDETSGPPLGAFDPASGEAGGQAGPLLLWLAGLLLLAVSGTAVLLRRGGRTASPSPLHAPADLPPAPWASYQDRGK